MFTYVILYILKIKYGYDVYVTARVHNHLTMIFENIGGKYSTFICLKKKNYNVFRNAGCAHLGTLELHFLSELIN